MNWALLGVIEDDVAARACLGREAREALQKVDIFGCSRTPLPIASVSAEKRSDFAA